MAEHSSSHIAGNTVVLVGDVTHDPEPRQLADGIAWQFDVATLAGADAESAARCVVPVNWYQPSESEIGAVTAGTAVVVIGSVRRRFFRSGGRTSSRTEVVPDRVIPLRRKASVAKALAAAAASISGADERRAP